VIGISIWNHSLSETDSVVSESSQGFEVIKKGRASSRAVIFARRIVL
jgi:hypothetical protein